MVDTTKLIAIVSEEDEMEAGSIILITAEEQAYYEKVGEYQILLPKYLKKTEKHPKGIGMYGKMRWEYLKENNPQMLIEMLLQEQRNGSVLVDYLASLDEEFWEKVHPLSLDIMKKEGTMELQDTDWWKFVQERYNAVSRAKEMLISQMICS